MATKTIACPECGAAVAPGRFACAECGALVAAVGMVPRTWPETTTPDPGPAVLAANGESSDLLTAVPATTTAQPADAPLPPAKRPRKPRAAAPVTPEPTVPAEASRPIRRPTRRRSPPGPRVPG